MSRPPNLLFFFTDDQRHDTLRSLGNERILTPNLDALARRGTVFTRAHIPGGTCGAVCMPSRAMLHTGRTLFRLDGEGQEIPEDHALLGETLRGRGYETAGIGKWHNGRRAFARSFSAGDEIFFGGMGDHWNVPAYRYDPSGRYETRRPFIADPFLTDRVEYRDGDHVEAGKHSTELFTDAALGWLEARSRADPFFLYVSLMAPHDPRSMPAAFRALYDPERIPLPGNFLPEHPIDTGALRIRDERLAAFPRNPAEIRRHIADYYAMITHLDDAFGRLTAALERLGELERTILVVAGDNGLALGQHGLMGKQSLYEHSVRVPLLMAGPGIPGGQRRDALVYLLDLFPTLCDLTGAAIPETVEGRSLRPCLEDPSAAVRDALYLAYEKTIRGVSDGRHKLIEYACGATQLFDLAADPLERRNLAGRPEAEGIFRAMRDRLREQAAAWGDPDSSCGAAFWSARPDLVG